MFSVSQQYARACSPENQVYPVLHQKNGGQQSEGVYCPSLPLHGPIWSIPSGLKTLGQVRAVRKGPEEGKEDDQQSTSPARRAEGGSGKTVALPFFT